MIPTRLHRRQFVVGPEPVQVYDDWRTLRLSPTLWLSHCPALPVAAGSDAQGKVWHLVGLAVQSAEHRPAPIDDLASADSADVTARTHDWAGRWVLLDDQHLTMDACGALGCYYGHHEDAFWLSTSPALIANQCKLGPADVPELILPHDHYWSPAPCTRTDGIRRLISSQVIDLTTGRTTPRTLVPALDGPLGPDDVARRFKTRLSTTINNLRSLEMPIWLGLTGGRDSRTVLALCEQQGVPIETFTRSATRMAIADHVLPPKLSAMCGFEHRFLPSKPIDKSRTTLALQHSLCEVTTYDMMPFLTGTRETLDGVMIGGHGFEVFSTPLYPEMPETLDGDLWYMAELILRFHAFKPEHWPKPQQGLNDWLQWTKACQDPQLDWRGRYAIEQDNGAWPAQKDLVYDLDRVSRFPLVNCAKNYALLLSLPLEDRQGSAIHKRILREVRPDLLDLPFNPKNRTFSIPTILRAKSLRLPAFLYSYLDTRRWRYMNERRNRKASARRQAGQQSQ